MKLDPNQDPARRPGNEITRVPGTARNPASGVDPFSGLKPGTVMLVRILGIAQGASETVSRPPPGGAGAAANPSPAALRADATTAGTGPSAQAAATARPGGAVPRAADRPPEKLMLVEIRGRTLVAQAPAQMQAGMTFEARLERGAGSVPRLVAEPRRDLTRAAPAQAQYRVAAESARAHRYSVKTLAALVPRLTTLAAEPGARERTPSLVPLQRAVSRLIAALPKPASLGDPALLQKAVALRGTGYESAVRAAAAASRGPEPPPRTAHATEDPAPRIARTASPAPDLRPIAEQDLKPLLMRLRDAAAQVADTTARGADPPRVAGAESAPRAAAATGADTLPRLAEAIGRTAATMLAQIEVQQLAPVTGPVEGARLIDLALWPDDRLQGVEIEFDPKGHRDRDQREASRSLTLRLDLDTFGELSVLVDFRPGDLDSAAAPAIGARFLTRTASLAEMLQAELPELRTRLETHGFEVTRLASAPGKVPARSRPEDGGAPLIDVET